MTTIAFSTARCFIQEARRYSFVKTGIDEQLIDEKNEMNVNSSVSSATALPFFERLSNARGSRA
jgi:hypothetical protein